ncbi:MAG TPA: cytochrome c oxidase subunit 3, partial [Pirellulaceae bacterium]|nr:cytochrome c oxidase subunit 3 [Pirellulaceae bacterium]
MTETLQVGEWPRERAVPVSNGRLAMWLFLSTEVMFFAALLSSYAIFRISAEDWPTAADMNVHPWIGLLNTVVLLISSVTLSWTVRSLRIADWVAARRWLLLTLLLGTGFLMVKGFEFSDKWRHGIFNWGESPLIHDRADLHYLAHLKRTLRGSTVAVAVEETGTGEGSPHSALDDWSRIVVGGLVDWTGQFVGQESDPALRRRALANTAALVYP